MRRVAIALATVLLATVVISPATASAASRFTDLRKEPAIMDKVDLVSGRFEASPFFGVSMLDGGFLRVLPVGLNLTYHPTFWLGVSAHVGAYVAKLKTKTLRDVCVIRDDIFGGNDCGPPDVDNPPDKLRSAVAEVFVQADLKPFYGKASLFGALFFRYQFGLFVGFGAVFTNRFAPEAGEKGLKTVPSPTFGASVHLFFTEFLALNIQFRDSVVLENWYGVEDASGNLRNRANHLATFSFGISILMPFKAKRTR